MKWSRESRSFSRKEQFCQAQLQKVRNSWCTESRRSPPFLSAFMAEAGLETALAFSLCAGALTGLVHILQGPEGKRPRRKNENMGPSRRHLSRFSTPQVFPQEDSRLPLSKEPIPVGPVLGGHSSLSSPSCQPTSCSSDKVSLFICSSSSLISSITTL